MIHVLRYIKGTPGQGVSYENKGHTQIVGYCDADWESSLVVKRSTSRYCVFIGGNLISLKSKKQDVVVRSSAEAKYRAMALATYELIWLKQLFQKLRFSKDEQMMIVCDNQAALHITSNPVFYERTKHIKVNYHFIREKTVSECMTTSFVNSSDQLADIFISIKKKTYELIWLKQLFQKLRFSKDEQMMIVCDNQAALHITSNPVFHERTKHIKVNYHFIREKTVSECMTTSFVNSSDQLANIFTKSLQGLRIQYICNKLGAYDLYAPA